MKRHVSLEEISDGHLYDAQGVVKVGCGGCRGCSYCCRDMGESAILDPLDLMRMEQATGLSPKVLLEEGKIELNVVDGVVLPNLRMREEDGACVFLNREGRCDIHAFRPGICRLFPLGRLYHETKKSVVGGNIEWDTADSFQYFVQIYECPAPNKTKVRIRKWLEQPDLPRYEAYILAWHNFLEHAETRIKYETDDLIIRNINLLILEVFFMKPYDQEEDFYVQFEERLATTKDVLEIS
ncbi:MAG: YkgJ family cysteine cluster protein [Lachnospiraceae bacterium]|nr:YkgJ family cysteine cluster protein [Lachnospiraceae bacterium]